MLVAIVGLILPAATSGYCTTLPRRLAPRRTGVSLLRALPWAELCSTLDELPCFTVVDGQQLAFTGYKAWTDVRARLHVDAAAAEAELASARSEAPELDLRLQAVGLGYALTRSGGGTSSGSPSAARLFPCEADVEHARRLVGGDEIDWSRDEVPLFFCFQLQRRDEQGDQGGRLVTPLFLSYADAEAAVAAAEAATARAGGSMSKPLELRSTSLSTFARRLVEGGVADPLSVRFVPPLASMRLCAALKPLAATREGTMEGSAGLPPPTDSIARQALTVLFDGTRSGASARNAAGLFPD
jgi:hypothetical protein